MVMMSELYIKYVYSTETFLTKNSNKIQVINSIYWLYLHRDHVAIMHLLILDDVNYKTKMCLLISNSNLIFCHEFHMEAGKED